MKAINAINSSLTAQWRTRRARLRHEHVVVLALGHDRLRCSDADGLEASRLHVKAGDAVTWCCETHGWSVDFGRLSPFDRSRIEGLPGDSVTLRVREDAFSGVEYRYFATLRSGSAASSDGIREQPLIIVEPYAVPGL